MKYLNSYVPSQVRCKIFGIPIEGFSESNIVDIERENDVTTFRKAMDGSRTAFKDKYGSYRLTFHVNQTSEANTWLHLLFKLYQKTNAEFKMPIEVEERMNEGGTRFFALDCFFENEASTNFASDVGVKTWTFICHNGRYTQQGTYESNELYSKIQSLVKVVELADMVGIDLSSIESKGVEVFSSTMDRLKNLF